MLAVLDVRNVCTSSETLTDNDVSWYVSLIRAPCSAYSFLSIFDCCHFQQQQQCPRACPQAISCDNVMSSTVITLLKINPQSCRQHWCMSTYSRQKLTRDCVITMLPRSVKGLADGENLIEFLQQILLTRCILAVFLR